jgi:hypothetical protein
LIPASAPRSVRKGWAIADSRDDALPHRRLRPRLTGSPIHENAAKWAVQRMESWGLVNGHLEPWDFGRPGWLNEEASGHIVSPVKDNLVFEVLSWTPSTNGVTAQAVQLITPTGPPSGRIRGGSVVGPPEAARILGEYFRQSKIWAFTARPPRPAETLAGPTAHPSTPQVFPVSDSVRIRSNTTAIPGTPISTPWNGSWRKT